MFNISYFYGHICIFLTKIFVEIRYKINIFTNTPESTYFSVADQNYKTCKTKKNYSKESE